MAVSLSGEDRWDRPYLAFIRDQCFASHLTEDDFIQSYYVQYGPRLFDRTPVSVEASGKSHIVRDDDDMFVISLDVSQFKYEDIKIFIVAESNLVVIHGKHEKKADDYGLVEREFTRTYQLPINVDMEKIYTGLFTRIGIMHITALKKALSNQEQPIAIDATRSGRIVL